MLVKLKESKLFTVDPAVRFAKEYQVSPKIWHEMWKRHLFYEYDLDGLCGYFQYKTGKRIKPHKVTLWIQRSYFYSKANHIIRLGQRVVDSQYFGIHEQPLIKELTKNMLFKGNKDSRTIV